jgi:hypothetical protein
LARASSRLSATNSFGSWLLSYIVSLFLLSLGRQPAPDRSQATLGGVVLAAAWSQLAGSILLRIQY